MKNIRMAVVGAGQFGRHHCRVVHESARARLAAVVDTDAARAAEAAAPAGALALADYRELAGRADAAIVAAPTCVHAEIGCALMAAGLDVLVEKPIAPDMQSAARLVETAERHGRILQVGHLERFNPAVAELEARTTLPLFFEVHRLSVFSPRSLDIDVVLDLMIHDIDIVLNLAGADAAGGTRGGHLGAFGEGGYRQRAAGVRQRVRGESHGQPRFDRPGAQAAPLPAGAISLARLRAAGPGRSSAWGRTARWASSRWPWRRPSRWRSQLEAFLDAVETRKTPKTSGDSARQTLGVALAILDKIKEHTEVVSNSLAAWKQ